MKRQFPTKATHATPLTLNILPETLLGPRRSIFRTIHIERTAKNTHNIWTHLHQLHNAAPKKGNLCNLMPEIRKAISLIAKNCRIFEAHSFAPRRFKITVCSNNFQFNHSVQVGTMFLQGPPVCNIVD